MAFDIVLTILLTTVIQSVFGVGVLLFGTPLLLLFDYSFLHALSILLPISLSINTIQIVRHYIHIDLEFYKKILLYCIPMVIASLVFVTQETININLLIGLFLIFVGLQNHLPKVNQLLQQLMRYETLYLLIMGIVHGLTNLGGSLLTAIVHNKQLDKHATRVTVAAAYASFALFQIATLFFAVQTLDINILHNLAYLIFAFLIYMMSEEVVYVSINNSQYRSIFAVFLLISGLLLITKALN